MCLVMEREREIVVDEHFLGRVRGIFTIIAEQQLGFGTIAQIQCGHQMGLGVFR